MTLNTSPDPDATVFGLVSFTRLLFTSGVAIIVFLVVVRPEASLGLNALDRTLYWTLHVSAGLAAVFAASRLMLSYVGGSTTLWVNVLMCGLLGTLLIAPVYAWLDSLWPSAGSFEVDDALDRLAARHPLGAVIAEAIEALPWILSAWFMINLPLLMGLTGTDTRSGPTMDDSVDEVITSNDQELSQLREAAVEFESQQSFAHDKATQIEQSGKKPQDETTHQFLNSIPGFFGKDVIAVASDLHYLNVFTVTGKTTVLGNLRDVVAELDSLGLQVHRSHWIAHAHVTRIVNTGGEAACIMSNGIRVPVSRRKWKMVREHYGHGVIQRNLS